MSLPPTSRRHSSRSQYDNTHLKYSVSYHPIDNLIRPKQAAKKLKKAGNSAGFSCITSREVPAKSSKKDERRLLLPSQRTVSAPNVSFDQVKPRTRKPKGRFGQRSPYDMTWHPIDDFDNLQQSKSRPRVVVNIGKTKSSQVPSRSIEFRDEEPAPTLHADNNLGPHSTTTSCPANTKNGMPKEIQGQTFNNEYSIEHVAVSYETIDKDSDSCELRNHISKSGWTKMVLSDQRLFLVGKGAVIGSELANIGWSDNSEYLDNHARFDSGDESGILSTQKPEKRYEEIRLGLDAYFKAQPEKGNKRDWDLHQTEGLEVYDMQAGEKYWRHDAERHLTTKGRLVTLGISSLDNPSKILSEDRAEPERPMTSGKMTESQPSTDTRHSAEFVGNQVNVLSGNQPFESLDDIEFQILTNDAIPFKWQGHSTYPPHQRSSSSLDGHRAPLEQRATTTTDCLSNSIQEDVFSVSTRNHEKFRHRHVPTNDPNEKSPPESADQDRLVEDSATFIEPDGTYDELLSIL